VNFSGSLIFPIGPGLERPVESDGSWTRAVVNAAAAVPAFIRMQDHGRLPFFGIRNIDIDLADFNTMVAAVAALGIESDGLVGCSDIGHGDYFILSHIILRNMFNFYDRLESRIQESEVRMGRSGFWILSSVF
jgi:hypothetical protein